MDSHALNVNALHMISLELISALITVHGRVILAVGMHHTHCMMFTLSYNGSDGMRCHGDWRLCIERIDVWDPFYWYGLTLIPAWISYHMTSKVWDDSTYPFANFNDQTVEVCWWMGRMGVTGNRRPGYSSHKEPIIRKASPCHNTPTLPVRHYRRGNIIYF